MTFKKKTKIMLKVLGYTLAILAYMWFLVQVFPLWLTSGTIKSLAAVVIAVLGTTVAGLHLQGVWTRFIHKTENQKTEEHSQ